MGLKLKLRAGEKVYLNGALVQNGSASTELEILNRVPLLRQKDILLDKEVQTPCQRVYFLVQALYFSPPDEVKILQMLGKLSVEIVKAAPSMADRLNSIHDLVVNRKYYAALKSIKELISYEAQLIENAKSTE